VLFRSLGLPQKLDQDSIEEKPAWLKAFQDLTASFDSSGLCLFTTFAIGGEELAAQMTAATGIPYTADTIMKAGERIWNLERLFNLAVGFTSADDTIPSRLMSEPIPTGPAKGKISRLPEMLPNYYQVRGWDESGVPTDAKLAELGLARL
jgi:aldehyde:ferredoxin oxidoreductase